MLFFLVPFKGVYEAEFAFSHYCCCIFGCNTFELFIFHVAQHCSNEDGILLMILSYFMELCFGLIHSVLCFRVF